MVIQKDLPGPNGTIHPLAGQRVLLLKAIYGLPESNMLFEKERNLYLVKAGFTPMVCEPSIFLKRCPLTGRLSVLFIHVDDGQLFCINSDHWTTLKSVLESRFGALRVHDQSDQHVGITFTRFTDGSFSTSQSGYIAKMAKVLNCDQMYKDVTPSHLSLFKDDDLTIKDSEPVNLEFYQQIIGLLIYSLHTRHDVRKEIIYLSGKVALPVHADLVRASKVVRYLCATPHLGPHYHSTEGAVLYGYVDAAFNVHTDGRSHSGYFTCIGEHSAPTMSYSAKQTACVSLSSMEAEYVALSELARTIASQRTFLTELGFPPAGPTVIFEDNKSAINLAVRPTVPRRSKHIHLRHHFIKDLILNGTVHVVYIDTKRQRANILTKALPNSQYVIERDDLMNLSELHLKSLYVPRTLSKPLKKAKSNL